MNQQLNLRKQVFSKKQMFSNIKSHRMTPVLECLFVMKIHTLKPWTWKHENYACFAKINSLNMEDGWRDETKFAFVERNLYFILLCFYKKGIKPDLNCSVKSYNFSMWYGLCTPFPTPLFMGYKERYNL